jgi:thioredoxin 1
MIFYRSHVIAPTFDKLSEEYPSINFTKVDIDVAGDIAEAYSITAIPTFIFLKEGQPVDTVKSANPTALTSTVQKYAA